MIALHFASLNGHTETAMALLAEKADVHCRDNKGYVRGAASHGLRSWDSFVLHCAAESAWLCRVRGKGILFSAGGRRCTMRR